MKGGKKDFPVVDNGTLEGILTQTNLLKALSNDDAGLIHTGNGSSSWKPQGKIVPDRRMAVVHYTGFWSDSGYLKNKLKLTAWIRKNEFTAVGDPIWARYNPPFTPRFLRRNEILIQVAPDENQDMDQANIDMNNAL